MSKVKKVTYTSTLPLSLMNFLTKHSKKTKQNKSQIITLALKKYELEIKKQEYTDSFKKASNDQEQNDLTEMGMDDYWSMIKSI